MCFSQYLQLLFTLILVERVVAFEAVEVAKFQLKCTVSDLVEECAVVGYHDERAVIILEVLLDPVLGHDIEVISWLVKYQQGRVL